MHTRSLCCSVILVVAILVSAFVALSFAHADEPEKTVRVGWYETPFNITDQFGRRSGYAYEYQRKVAAYTGWNYEYVEGSWFELMQMLERGEIDLMSDVSYKEDRTEKMLYSSLPMGTEAYYVFVKPDNTQVAPDDFSSLNGKAVGVTSESIQEDQFIAWMQKHGVQANLVELTGSEEEALNMLQKGELDAFVTLDTYGNPETAVPVWKVGASDFFFAVNKDRPDLLNELDIALNMIQEEDKYYNQQLSEQFLGNGGTNLYLSTGEKAWLSGHGTIRVGYQDNYLAFFASDPATGELTGALKDWLSSASDALENAHLDFEPRAYPTAAAALEALKSGEVDCMFPANLTSFDGEELGVVMTPALMRTEMDAVVRASEQKEFILQRNVTVCVNEGNTNYEMFLVDNYPSWNIAYYPDTPTGLEAIAAGKADCVIISNYRFSNISKQCEELHLTTVPTGVDMDYYMAVREGDAELYSILTKVTSLIPESTVNASLTYYSTEDAKRSFYDIIVDNLAIIMTVVAVVLLIIVLLLIRNIRARRILTEEERLVDDLNKRVFVDALTSVRNKGAFDDYIQEFQERLDKGEQIEFAIGVFDCDNLKRINDQYGHGKGNEYLKASSRLICETFRHSPVFRVGGDEFAAILMNDDLRNKEQLARSFDEAQERIRESAESEWERVLVSLGVAVHDASIDRSVRDTVRRADEAMYENKRLRKQAREQQGLR